MKHKFNMTAYGLHFFLLLAIVQTSVNATANFTPPPLEGQTFIHDPSTIVKDGTNYFIFGTGPDIRTKSSSDLIHWTNGTSVFRTPPAWTKTFVPAFQSIFWAPDVIRMDGKYFLYYAVSTWGKQVSAIGLATNPTLDPAATNYLWTDCGPVITSTNDYAFNTIDPSVFRDADGKLWLRHQFAVVSARVESFDRGIVPDAAWKILLSLCQLGPMLQGHQQHL
jgi:arabinan endo-1,5-alpha-L-arabinosidase